MHSCQCGMVNYPKSGDTIHVRNVSSKADCRAYRVFEHYISRLEERLDDAAFLCEPVEEGGCRAYACSFCKRACAASRHLGRSFRR